MRHLKEYEEADLKDLIDDLEGVGQGGLVGFMWIGSIPKGEHMGFLVVHASRVYGTSSPESSKITFHSSTCPTFLRSPIRSFRS